MHSLEKQPQFGFGIWHVCSVCGTAKHSGFWFFAGKKSKDEPPCSDNKSEQANWLKSAT
jgi:hypothetical protein